MANLKTYLQSLIESVFTNKKEYIGQQAFPKSNGWINIDQQSSGEYVAPEDGYILFFVSNTSSVDIHSDNSSNYPYSRSALSTSSTFVFSSTIKVRKGDHVRFNFKESAPTVFTFIPIEGS